MMSEKFATLLGWRGGPRGCSAASEASRLGSGPVGVRPVRPRATGSPVGERGAVRTRRQNAKIRDFARLAGWVAGLERGV